ncbi:MAG: HYC_CC_PP family protein [Haliscomenobacter sp.]
MLQRVGHILLAALVFLATSGVVLHKHYCRGMFRSQALFVQPPSCHEQVATCPFHANQAEEDAPGDKGCCDTSAELFKLDHPQWYSPFVFKAFEGAGAVCPIPPLPCSSTRVASCCFKAIRAFDLPPPGVPIHILIQVFRI